MRILPTRSLSHSVQVTTVLITGLMFTLIVATASAKYWLKRSTKVTSTTTTRSLAATAQNNSERPRVEVLTISIRLPGFVPREITRPAGYYFLSVTNLSGARELSLRLERENGERLHEVNLSRGKSAWRQNVHLSPGTYLLTEANHPDWVCRITVTP